MTKTFSTLYLKGYYGYKNFGDELLLLGVLQYLTHRYGAKKIIIEVADKTWMSTRIARHSSCLPEVSITYVSSLRETLQASYSSDMIIIGGGEVVTDARSFPHNGWNYLLRNYPWKLLGKKIGLIGGFGKPIALLSSLLHTLLYRGAYEIVCRERSSYERVCCVIDSSKVTLHEDFGYTILKSYETTPKKQRLCVINCNPYIWSEETKQRILTYCSASTYDRFVYFPAEISIDAPMYDSLKNHIPGLERFDWTTSSLEVITSLIASASGGIAARLHVLILLDHYSVPYEPLVYQEKITKILGHA